MRPNPFLPPERQRQPSQHQHQLQNQQQSPTPPALDLPRPLPWDLLYATASPRQLPTHSKPSPTHKPYRSTVGGSGAVVTRDSDQEREREEDTGKGRGRETPPHQYIPAPLLEVEACMRLFRTRRSETQICTRRCRSLRRMRLKALHQGYRLQGCRRGSINMGGIRRRGRSHLRYGCAASTTTTTTTTIATTAREF